MSIAFSREQWVDVKENARRWWAGELERPLMQLVVPSRDPGRPEPKLPSYAFTAFYDLSIPAEDIVDRWDYDLSTMEYVGDGFPSIWPNFGPGVIAALMGCELECGNDTVWFHPKEIKEIAEISFKYNPDNIWLHRIKDICRAAVERWEGLVQVGMTDLGGNLDILSSFRPSERLLLDLYDYPEEVKRLTWEAHEMWWKYFDEINTVLQPTNPGYTAWAPMFSEEPYYILQCDFCYMIGPETFDEFVKPELAASCKRLTNPFYHLDGPGELPHLDSLLSIPELKGIQWIAGTNNIHADEQWPVVYRKVRDAGKLIQTSSYDNNFEPLVAYLGSGKGIILLGSAASIDEARSLVKKYGAD
ncbi:hypothetical protein LLG39_06645 [bacterium]|nr:hypothetical protein [bacterium]